MKKLKDTEIGYFVLDWRFILPLLLTVVTGFGVYLANFTIGVDDLARGRYAAGELFAQGRFSSFFINKLFHFKNLTQIYEPVVALVFLVAAAILLCIIVRRTRDVSMKYFIVLSCAFVSYPLINEIFIYKGANRNITIGYFLAFLTCLIGQKAIKTHKKIALRMTIMTVIAIFIMSLYESLALAYAVLFCTLIIIDELFEKKKLKFRISEILCYSLPFILGTGLEYVLEKILKSTLNIADSTVSAADVYTSSGTDIVSIFYMTFRKFFLAGIGYFPILVFAISVISGIIAIIIISIRKKSVTIALSGLGIFGALFILSLLTKGCVKYRMCQAFAVFTAFSIMGLIYLVSKITRGNRIIPAIIASIIITAQAYALSTYFQNDVDRWKEEKAVLTAVCDTLEGDDAVREKPVIFLGEYTLSDKVLAKRYVKADNSLYGLSKKAFSIIGADFSTSDYDDTYVLGTCQHEFSSVITWGIDAFDDRNKELRNVLNYMGYDNFQIPTPEIFDYYEEKYENYEAAGDFEIITENDAVIVIFA